MADYNLDALGWFQFERLCQALLKSEISLAVESWGGSADRGADAYYDGSLRYPDRNQSSVGPFLFQAKFVSHANAVGSKFIGSVKGAISAELTRIDDRRRAGTWLLPKHYTFITNAPLTTPQRSEVRTQPAARLPGASIHVLAASDLDAMLDSSASIRLSYPQLLGLRDLNELLRSAVHSDVLTRSRIAFDTVRELAETFVPTHAYSKALNVLHHRNFVVLTGPPEMGKTSTARMIALARLSGGWEAYECNRPDDLFKVHDKSRPQIFVADDAFGSTEYRPELADAWARDLDRIISAVDHRHWVIWTSRPAPLEEALRLLHFQGKARDFPEPGRVQVNDQSLNTTMKAQILYRLAKRQNLDDDERAAVRDMAKSVVFSEHFTPLRVERLVKDDLPEIMALPDEQRSAALQRAVASGLKTPTGALKTSFAALSVEQKRLLISMLDVSANTASEATLLDCYRRHAPDTATTAPRQVLGMLDDHFITIRPELRW